MELVDTTAQGVQLHNSQVMVSPSILDSINTALQLGATALTVHADGDLKTDLGGWVDTTFTSDTIKGSPAPGCDVARTLAEGLRTNTTVRDLYVERHGLTAEELRPLAESLAYNETLVKLHLGQNKLSDAGCPLLAQTIRSPLSGVLALHLPRCCVGPQGAAALAGVLTEGSTLHELHLGHNRLGDDGAAVLARALHVNEVLRVLCLSSNSIGDRGATACAEALGSVNRTLLKLELQSNKIGSVGTRQLAWACSMNMVITTLKVQDNLEDQERMLQSLNPCDLPAGACSERAWRSPPIAASEAASTMRRQIAINQRDPASKISAAKLTRTSLRQAWAMAYHLVNSGKTSTVIDPAPEQPEQKLLLQLCDLPSDAFRVVIDFAVPVPHQYTPDRKSVV